MYGLGLCENWYVRQIGGHLLLTNSIERLPRALCHVAQVLDALALWEGETMSTEGSQSVPERTEKTRKEYGPLVKAIKAVGSAMFKMGDALLVEFPRTKVRWTSRDGAETTESEILSRLGAQAGMDRTTLVAARNTAASFPKSVRLVSVPFSVYKALQAEAWADGGARRTQIVEWIAEARKAGTLTAESARDHATAVAAAPSRCGRRAEQRAPPVPWAGS